MRKLYLSFFLKTIVFILFFFGVGIPREANACEACNRLFLGQLQNQRAGSLVSQELLASIAAQQNIGRNNPAAQSEGWSNNTLIASNTPTPAGQSRAPQVQPVQGGSPGHVPLDNNIDFIDIIRRDNRLPIPPTSFVPQNSVPNKHVRITLEEGDAYIGNGVIYKGFTIDGKIPGPTIIVDEGDIVDFKIVNNGELPHGASIHSVNSQTSKYLGKVEAGDSANVVFKANMPGVYMYHCAPGGHAIPMHIIFGQYGMMVVRPKKKYELERVLGKDPDIEIFLVQHEYYASGKDAVEGQGKPMYTAFNGKLFRYVEEPIVGKPGDYVRINFLNAGPNLLSTFHIVGIIWDFAYWQGHPDNQFIGGQTVTAGPSDSWVIEFRIPPDEGTYMMLTHAVGSTDRGAIGLLVCDRDAEAQKTYLSDGIKYSDEQMARYREQALRTITPFGIGSPDVDVPVVFGPETKEVTVRIIGNSYYPKVIQVAPGTAVRWINEDVFSYMEGEFAGIHNVIVKSGPERFASDMLAHAESHSQVLTQEGEYLYICTPHPYMEGKIIVSKDSGTPGVQYAGTGTPATSRMMWVVLVIAAFALMIALISLINK
ncbi:MAG: multicopper oxidase domain-containing protein [Bacteroidales bacterium]|jgi:nitrite reductase (NO-forming)|nr:multicopper oxidase domain-containing protein [Bacteroidales bacterium]NLM93367.1 multicopper oxidase domain-containing protein [Bacteroidales bacterium]